ncbi:MAG TPA: DUF2264 domain-containing protein [Puia sp.]|nr:DUF2264 domain-containing protein [Puia sp.]
MKKSFITRPLAALAGVLLLGSVAVGQRDDRTVWLNYMDRVARPVVSALAEGKLHASMPVALSQRIDNAASRSKVTYLEAWGRTLSGIGRWLNAEGGSSSEIALRRQYREWALKAVANSVDPSSADYMVWKGGQPLVDASFFALGLIRCPWLWEHLDSVVRRRVVAALLETRPTVPGYSNWILFPAVIEAFFCKYGLDYDPVRIEYALREFSQHWYVGDGLFSDGPAFHQDYYNSYVIQPFLLAVLDVVGSRGRSYAEFDVRMRRIAERYAELQERMIGVDGSFPVTGRSITYRSGAFHALADVAARGWLPGALSPGQVRSALTAVIRRTLGAAGTFTAGGWLTIGLAGHQEGLADVYITGGSEYLCSEVFQPLGLEPSDAFWSAPAQPWTAVKVWGGGDSVRVDHALELTVAAGVGGARGARGAGGSGGVGGARNAAEDVRRSGGGAEMQTAPYGYKLVWADEFNEDGRPDPKNWDFERGFVRNHEAQWYQPDNAWCSGGHLIIEARKEQKPNPLYEAGSKDWRRRSPTIEYTSASLRTRGLHSWRYGRFEMRARIDVDPGLWPAFWTLGDKGEWPSNGEIDVMEYYRRTLLANIATGTAKRSSPLWFSRKAPLDSLGGADWAREFHVWRMDWDEKEIRLSVDDKTMLVEAVDSLENRDGSGINPFRQPEYLLVNLAVGGDAGGDPSGTEFPKRYEIDYIRVYQKDSGAIGGMNAISPDGFWPDVDGQQSPGGPVRLCEEFSAAGSRKPGYRSVHR